MDSIHDILESIQLEEARKVKRLLDDQVGVHQVYDVAFEEMASKDKFDQVMAGAAASLRKNGNDTDKGNAQKIEDILRRKSDGEKIVRYISIILGNRMTFEFWQLENGWVGWQGYDYEHLEDDQFIDDMLKDFES